MRSTFAPLAFVALAAANPMPQGVTQQIKPPTSPPAGCSGDYNGKFNIQTVTTGKRDLSERQNSGTLTLTLAGGVLKDMAGRIGYIAANRQFQFDGPPQTGAIYTAGFSVCPNNTLTIGAQTTFQSCLSGDFYNLYDQNTAPQCSPVYIQAIPAGGAAAPAPAAGATQIPDGQPQASKPSQIPDGQVQAPKPMVSQIGDGQPQAPKPAVSQIADGQPQAPKPAVSQIADGQPQAPKASQIGDGQVQAPKATQIPDGQVQAPKATQIPDGQVQAPKASQIPDGQVQAPKASQIPDGQVQAPKAGNGTAPAKPSASVQPFTGAASSVRGDLFALVAAGFIAVLAL